MGEGVSSGATMPEPDFGGQARPEPSQPKVEEVNDRNNTKQQQRTRIEEMKVEREWTREHGKRERRRRLAKAIERSGDSESERARVVVGT